MAAQLAQLSPAELSKLPSMPLPAGATIDFGGPNPLKTTIISVTSVFIGLALLLVGIRAYTKIKINRSGSWDDRKSEIGTAWGGRTLIEWKWHVRLVWWVHPPGLKNCLIETNHNKD